MTQTPSRDWQKDMEMFEDANSRGVSLLIGKSAAAAGMHWLKEAKTYKQSYDATLTHYTAEKARAGAAKELLLDAIGTMMAYNVPALHRNRIVKEFATLYPDTPAPTNEEE